MCCTDYVRALAVVRFPRVASDATVTVNDEVSTTPARLVPAAAGRPDTASPPIPWSERERDFIISSGRHTV